MTERQTFCYPGTPKNHLLGHDNDETISMPGDFTFTRQQSQVFPVHMARMMSK